MQITTSDFDSVFGEDREGFKEIKERIVNLNHRDRESLAKDIKKLKFHKRIMEDIIDNNNDIKIIPAVIEVMEESILEMEEAISIAELKIHSSIETERNITM